MLHLLFSDWLLPDLHALLRELAPDLEAVGVRLRLVREDEMELELRLRRHFDQLAVANRGMSTVRVLGVFGRSFLVPFHPIRRIYPCLAS